LRINLEKKEERERVAHSLLRATLELAAAHGFSSLGLREVSRAAGIAPTSFYRHFADMEELGLALIDGLVGDLVQELSAAESAPSQDTVEVLVNRTLAAVGVDPELFRFILAERAGAVPSFRNALERHLTALSSALGGVEVGGGKATSIEDADAAVVLLFEGCGHLLDHGAEHVPMLRERIARQARLLLGRTAGARARP
jgi:AcrR family transcriptional regulator